MIVLIVQSDGDARRGKIIPKADGNPQVFQDEDGVLNLIPPVITDTGSKALVNPREDVAPQQTTGSMLQRSPHSIFHEPIRRVQEVKTVCNGLYHIFIKDTSKTNTTMILTCVNI